MARIGDESRMSIPGHVGNLVSTVSKSPRLILAQEVIAMSRERLRYDNARSSASVSGWHR